MAFFEWKDEYSVGIAAIDEQHKVIVRLMNELFEAIEYGRDEPVLKAVFVELLKYANYHFGLELRMFQEFHYGNERLHVEEHNHYINKIETLMIQGYLTERDVALETLHYLRSWFQNHMLKTDMEYCRFFQFKDILEEIGRYLEAEKAG